MKKYLFLIFFCPSIALGAIAFDSSLTTSIHSSPSTSVTDSFTNTAGDSLFIGVTSRGINDNVTSCTYDSVSASLIQKYGNGGALSSYSYIYWIPDPSTGTHNIVCSFSGSPTDVRVSGVSYSGTATSTQADAIKTASFSSVSSWSDSLTTLTNGSWVVAWPFDDANDQIAGTGATARGSSANPMFFDSDSQVNPAGSYTIGSSWSGSGNGGYILFSVIPSVVDVYGCTVSECTNYNPSATIDDGSCIYSDATTTEALLRTNNSYLGSTNFGLSVIITIISIILIGFIGTMIKTKKPWR